MSVGLTACTWWAPGAAMAQGIWGWSGLIVAYPLFASQSAVMLVSFSCCCFTGARSRLINLLPLDSTFFFPRELLEAELAEPDFRP